MKKITAVFLSLIMLALPVCVPAYAEQALPESEHEYANDFEGEWSYTVPGAVGLYVSFSDDTYVDPGAGGFIFIKSESSEFVTVGDVVNSVLPFRIGDTIYVYGSEGLVGAYDGDELAGRRIFVPGDTVRIVLRTDGSVTAYGFRVTDVTPVTEDDRRTVTYHSCREGLDDFTRDFFRQSDPVCIDYWPGYEPEGAAFVGWALTEGGKVAYKGGETIAAGGEDADLYAVWVDMLLGEDEVFYFSNSGYYFELTDDGTYYITKEDYDRMQANLYRVYGIGPMPSVIMSIVLAYYPTWEFQGSCYGMSTCVALQHFGKIDMLGLQDADCVRDLEPDETLISFIDYYQTQAATSWITENKGVVPGDAVYRATLKAMYDAVASGKLVMFTYYTGTVFATPGHTVLLTGCYEDAEGNHVILSYNCNYPYRYRDGNYASEYVISPDWSTVYADDEDEPLGAINWTADFSQFESFDIGGKGNILTWYKAFFAHVLDLFKGIRGVFEMLFAR